jgi:predicted dehydrogenase
MQASPELREGRTSARSTDTLLIAGLGSIGRRHLDNLTALGQDEIVLFRRSEASREERVPVMRDLEAALALKPKAVLVCNPTAFHIEVALRAARAGCHLFIEKPLSDSMDGIGELCEEVDKRQLTVFVGFQFRFHPALRQIRSWLLSSAIGEVVSVRAHWGEYLPGWHPGEDYRNGYSAQRALGGGVVLTLSHPFDYLRWLLGEVTAVSAEAVRRSGLGLDVEDTAHVILRFACGALGSVSLDYVERPPSHELHIVGQRGVIRWRASDGVAQLEDVDRGVSQAFRAPEGFGRNTMFIDEMRHFLACIEGREKPLCTLEDGIRALRIALAAKRAAQEGRVVLV